MFRRLLCLGWLFAFSPAALAETGPAVTPPVPENLCSKGGHFDDFDFWLGDWKVYGGPGKDQFAGENTISKIEKGCILHERWRGNSNSSGQSFNFYNPVSETWRQIWVAPPGYMIDIEGGLVNGSMTLEGTITYYQGGTHRFRGTWTPNDDGSVRQYFQQHSEEKSAWQDWFDGRYVKAESSSPAD